METGSLTLFQLLEKSKKILKAGIPGTHWIVAEINEIRVNRNGHAYLELVEKGDKENMIKAKASATIWAYTFRMLLPYFETTTGRSLSSGLKILINVSVEFHELYGFSLNIKDIDPSYTLGDIARRRLEILARLEREGVLNMNKETILPIVPQRIAIISSSTAAGLGDFMDQLTNNQFGYKYYTKLFNTTMQGEQGELSIINSLERIFLNEQHFDIVVIIRGGGSQTDLHCFDSYNLAFHITQFPIPVITGIGHERDESIADKVAHLSLKTPTAVAGFIIARASEFEEHMFRLKESVVDNCQTIIHNENSKMVELKFALFRQVNQVIKEKNAHLNGLLSLNQKYVSGFQIKKKYKLSGYMNSLQYNLKNAFKNKSQQMNELSIILATNAKSKLQNGKSELEKFALTCSFLDPVNTMKRGYSITFRNGKPIKSSGQVKEGDLITTQLFDGKTNSVIVP